MKKGRGQDTKYGIQNRYLHSTGASDFGQHLQREADDNPTGDTVADLLSHLDRLTNTDPDKQGHYEKLGTISPDNAEKWKSLESIFKREGANQAWGFKKR